MASDRTGVLFVCLGNICRSPLAKVVFRDLASRRAVLDRFEIDSCGTGAWHAGEPADPRACAAAGRAGLALAHVARCYDPRRDPDRFGVLVAMDRANRDALRRLGAPAGRVALLRAFDPALRGRDESLLDVPDPYYGGPEGFDEVLAMLRTGCAGLLEHLLARDERAVGD